MADATNGADVQNQDAPVYNPANSPRNLAMAQIAQHVNKELSGELSDFNEDTGEITARAPAPTTAPVAAPAPAAAPAAAAPAVTAAPAQDADQTEKIIVDGVEMTVSMAKIIEAGRRTLQKESAADKRLQDASELFRQAQQAAAHAGVNGLPDKGVQVRTAPSGEDGQDNQQQHQQQAIDPSAIGAEVQKQVTGALYWRDASAAAEKFKEEFPEIVGNPILMNWVVQQENQRIADATASGQPLGDPFKAYRAHGEATREQFKSMAPPAVTTTTESKADRKRDTVVVSSANVRTPAPQADKPKTTAQIIADMRQGRHQRIN